VFFRTEVLHNRSAAHEHGRTDDGDCMHPLSPELVGFVFELCDRPTQDASPEALVEASRAVPDECVPAVADEVRRLWDQSLLHTDPEGRLRPTIDGLWIVLQRARELAVSVPPGLLVSLGSLPAHAHRPSAPSATLTAAHG
jgi:hypothetical protein